MNEIKKLFLGWNVMVILNEKEPWVSFPNPSGDPYIDRMFYGNSTEFHE